MPKSNEPSPDAAESRVTSRDLFGAVGPCADPITRVRQLYSVNTAAGHVRGQLRILSDMSRDNGVPDWYCARLDALANVLLTVTDLETPSRQAEKRGSD